MRVRMLVEVEIPDNCTKAVLSLAARKEWNNDYEASKAGYVSDFTGRAVMDKFEDLGIDADVSVAVTENVVDFLRHEKLRGRVLKGHPLHGKPKRRDLAEVRRIEKMLGASVDEEVRI